jgi:hypothetical protein
MLISISDFMATRSDIKNLKKVEDDQSLMVIRYQVLEMADKLD